MKAQDKFEILAKCWGIESDDELFEFVCWLDLITKKDFKKIIKRLDFEKAVARFKREKNGKN